MCGQRWRNPKLQTNCVFPTTTDPADGHFPLGFEMLQVMQVRVLPIAWLKPPPLPEKSLLCRPLVDATGLMEHFPVFSSLGSGFPMNSP